MLHWTVAQLLLFLAAIFVVFLILRYFLEKLRIGDLEKRSVLITGCDTGFGHELALRCLEIGMPVFAVCLSQKGVDNLVLKARSLSGELDAFVVDVTDDKSIETVRYRLETATKKFGGLHGLVNNAGITGAPVFDDFLSLDDYRKTADVNLWGVVRVTQQLKHLIKQRRGRIVTVASICARVGLPSLGPYTVSKYGVSAYCDVIRQELRPFGVSVHILEPGFFKTPLIEHDKIQNEIERGWKNAPQNVRDEYGTTCFLESQKSASEFLSLISSSATNLVVDAYLHALTARFPRSRYQIGWDSILLFIPMSYLPTGLQDYIFAFVGLFLPKPACCK